MRILITGHRGFIGQNMVKRLAPEHELTMFEWGDPLPVVKGLDLAIHLGAISATTERDVDKIMCQNYDFSQWLLDECARHQVNMQYSSSASVYGTGKNFKEDAPKNPMSPYAWSKYLFDRHVESREWPIRVQGFRYFNVFGKHEEHKGNQASPYFQFEKQIRETGKVKLFYGSDALVRDFVPVETVIDSHVKFFNVEESGIWNVGTGKPKSFLDVANEVIAKIGYGKIEYVPMPESLVNQYQRFTKADLDKYNKTINSAK